MRDKAKPSLHLLVVLFCLFFAVQAWTADSLSDFKNAAPERKLAFLNDSNSDWDNLDPVVVSRFKSMLDQLALKYQENGHEIANLTVKTQSLLENHGVSETLLNIMEGLNSFDVTSQPRPSFKERAVAYAMLRSDGMSHQKAIAGLREFMESIYRKR